MTDTTTLTAPNGWQYAETASDDGLHITIEVRSVYGKPIAYPVCPKAQLFASLTGHKTLTGFALRQIAKLGYEIISTANADWRAVQ